MKTMKFIIGIGIFMLFTLSVNAQWTVHEYDVAPPVVNLTTNDINDTICVGETLVFSTVAEPGTTYEYILDGISVQGPALSSSYVDNAMSVGDHEMIVRADNNSCQSYDTLNPVTVLPDINPGITNIDGGVICVGSETEFTATGVNAESYDFYTIVGGVHSLVQSGVVDTFAISSLNDGDGVYVIISNGECTETSITITMTVNPLPIATLVNDDAGEICAGIETISRATGGLNYDYQINAGSVQNSLVDTFSTNAFVNGDILTVVVTDANGCEATSAGITMTVHALPTIDDLVYSSAYSSAAEECPGTLVDVTLTMSGTSPFTVKVYDIVGGNPTGILFTESGLTGPVDVFSKPVDGGDVYYTIEDFYCPSVVITP